MLRNLSVLAACTLVLLTIGVSTAAAARPHGTEAALDPIMGEFEGILTASPEDTQTINQATSSDTVRAEAKVIADEDHKYRIILLSPAGKAKAKRSEINGIGQDGTVEVKGDWSGKVTKETLRLVAKVGDGGAALKADMKRVERKSPTLGQKPPAGAIVLLPYEEGKPTNLDQWSNKKWVCQDDGSILTHSADTKSNQEFGSYKLHVEFRVPFMPASRGQARGNSGVYQHGRYEIQVLDSFGLTENVGECGAIYGQKPADVNVCLPPGQWQTYDIDFTAPQFDAAGKQTKGAIISVVHNGVKIHDAVEAKNVTGGAWGAPAKTGPIRLQDHGNPTRFRNIWIVPAA